MDGSEAENLGTLIGAITMGPLPAAEMFRLGMLTAGGYEARNRNTERQREKLRDEDWKKIRPYIGPAVSMALITWLGSWILSSFFERSEYGIIIGFIMASALISVDISIKSENLRRG